MTSILKNNDSFVSLCDFMKRIEIKTPENQLRQEFISGYGYPPKIADAHARHT